jgi:outer membrane protein assembly factor BamA
MPAVCSNRVVVFRSDVGDRRLEGRIRDMAQRVKPDVLDDSITNLMTSEGYLDGLLTVADDTIIVDPKDRYWVGPVNLTIVDASGAVNEKTLTRYQSRVASKTNISDLKEDILSDVQQEGYYFASLNTDSVEIKNFEITLNFKLITGPLVNLQRIRFKGLSRSKPDFVRRLSGLRTGESFSKDRIDAAVRKIEARGYLQNDSLPRLMPNKNYDGVELLFYLRELKSNSLELGGGYLPRQGNQSGEFVGRLNFRSSNLFGAGRKIELLLDRKDRSSSRVEFQFVQPFFVPDHLELATHLTQIDYDSSYHSFTIDGKLSLITRGNTILTGGLSWTKTEPQRSSQPPSRSLSGTLGYEAQKLDYAPNPSGGRHLQIRFSYIHRLSWPDSVATTIINNESKFSIAADNYFHLVNQLIVRLNLEANTLSTSRELIDLSEQFKLGGFGSLRGYRQDQFAGRRTFLGQMELRFRPSHLAAIYIFGDLGFVYSRKELIDGIVDSESLTRAGSGVGLYAGSNNARLTLEVGWGRHDQLGEGKIHLGLLTMF